MIYELSLEYMYLNDKSRMMTFWVHRGLQYPSCSVLNDDGVHLNEEGNRRLLCSLRGALLYAESLKGNNKYFS